MPLLRLIGLILIIAGAANIWLFGGFDAAYWQMFIVPFAMIFFGFLLLFKRQKRISH